MATVRIPTPLRKLTEGQGEVTVAGGDLRAVITQLDAQHPGLGERLLDADGELRRFVNVFVRDEDVRFQAGLDTDVGDDDTVSIVPAVAGGDSGGVGVSWPGFVGAPRRPASGPPGRARWRC